jgi:hypothetical protein
MRGRLGADVLERENVRIFVNDFRWNLFRGNFAEQAISRHEWLPANSWEKA